jgi:hypothetical protein
MNCAIPDEQIKTLTAILKSDIIKLKNADREYSLIPSVQKVYKLVLNSTNDENTALAYARLVPGLIRGIAFYNQDIEGYLAQKGFDLNKLRESIETFKNIDKVKKFVVAQSKNIRELLEIVDKQRIVLSQYENNEDTKRRIEAANRPVQFTYREIPNSDTFQEAAPISQGEVEPATQNLEDTTPFKQRIYNLKRAVFRSESDSESEDSGINQINFQGEDLFYTLMRHNDLDKSLELDFFSKDVRLMTPAERNVFSNRKNNGLILLITDKNGNPLFFDEEGNITDQDNGKVVYTYPREKEQIAPSKNFPEQQAELIYHLEEAKSQVRKGAKIIFPITGILAPNINTSGPTRIKDIRLDANGLEIQLDEVPQEERREKIQFTEFAAKNAIWEQFLKLNGLVANSNQALEVNKPLFNDLTDLRDAVIFLLSEKEITVGGVAIDFQTRFEYLKTFFQEVKGKGLLTIPNTRTNNLIFDKNSGTVTTIIVKQDKTKETQVYNINDAENLKEVLEAFFSDRNSQYLSVNINRNNWRSGRFYDISVRNNTLNVVENGNYYEWVYNNVSVKATGLNANGQFRAQNPAFVFALSRDFKYVTAQEELPVETDEVPETTPEEDDAKNINPEGSIDTDNFDFDELFRQTDLENKVTQEEIDAAEKWWAQSPLSKHIPLNRLLAIVNSNAWATFSKSGITLYKGSSAVDIYHEAWHGFTQLYLTVAEKTRLYNEVRKKPGTFKTVSGEVVKFSNASFFQIEEYLAEQFRDYARQQTPEKGSPVKNTLFRRIWNFLKSLFGGVTNKTAYVDAMSVPAVAEAFNKLYFGQVLNLQPNINNSMFNVLNSAKSVVDQTPLNLNDEDLNLIRESIDGMVIDTILKKSGIEQQSKALLFLYTQNGRRILFTDIRFAFNDKLREINEQLEEDPDNYNLNNQKRILQIVVDNFGDIDAYAQNKETTGILDFYSRSSNSSISNLVSINDEDIEAETNPDATDNKELQGQMGDKKINNHLIIDYLPKALLTILSLIPDVSITEGRDADLIAGGKMFVYKRNSLGFPKVKNLGHTINAITKTLINESSYDNMLYKLGEAVDAFPVLGVLKAMLPNQDSFTQTSKTVQKQTLLDILIGFWQAFDKAKMEAFLNRQSPQQADAEQGETIRGNLFTIGRATNSLNNVFNNWSSNFKYKTPINRDGSILLDPAKLPRITEKVSYDKVFEFLEVLGVELTDTTKNVIRSGKISLDALKEAVLSMKNDIETHKNNQDFLANPLSFFTVKVKKFTSQRTLLGKIADIEMLYSPLYNNSIVLNANGDIVTDVSMHNSMTRKTAAINSSSNLTQAVDFNAAFNEELNPFFKHSIVRSKLFDKNGRRTKNFSLFIGYHLGYQKLDEYGNIVKGLAASDLTANQKFINDFYSFMLEGIMPTLVHESKSSVYVNYIQDQNGSASLYVDANSFVDTILPSKANIIINNYIRAEYERILLFKTDDLYKKNQALNKDVIVIDSEGKEVTRKAGDVFTAFDDILSAETKENLYRDIAEGVSSRVSIDNNSAAIANDLRSYFEKNEALNTKRFNESSSEIFIDQNIVDRVFDTQNNERLNPQDKNNVLLRAYTVNYFIHRFEMNNFYYGDMAQYDHTKEAGTKYDAGAASGGPGFITDQWILDEINKNYPKTYSESVMRELRPDNAVKATTEILNTSIIKEDTGIRSVSLDDMINKVTELRHQREKGSKKKIKDEVIKAFDKAYGAGMKIGDGHGYINLDTYRHLKIAQDNWLPQQEALYQKIVNGETLDENDAKFFFPTYKLQMYGDLQTEAPITALHKFSLSPLIPNVIEDSLLNDIHKVMIINNIDYITYPSGSKISNVENPVDLYEDNDRNKINMDVEFVVNPVNISYLKEVTSNTNLWKAGQTFATQMRKLIVENLFLDGRIIPGKEVLVEKYLERIKDVTESLENDLLDEIGWVKNPDGTYSGSKEKLAAFLQKQLEKKNIPSYIVDLLSVTEEGTFINDLSAIPNAQIIESIIFSVISRRLILQKSYGEGLVQVPGSFWRKATESERKKWLGTNNFLPFYEYDPVRVKAMKVALTMHGDYFNLFQRKDLNGIKIGTYEFVEQEDGTTKKVLNLEASLKRLNTLIKDDKWLDKDDNRKAITILGVRIPVQGQSSIDAAEIYEFLPPGAGNIIVLPSEIVGKSGGDFDFDKLPSLFPRISRSGKIISASKYATKQDVRNRISELEKELNLDRKDVKKYVKEIIDNLKADKKVTKEELNSVANILEYAKIRRDFIVEDINKLIALDIENGQSKFLPKPLQKALSKPDYENKDIIKALRISSKILNKKGENILERFNKRLYSKIQEFDKLKFEELEPLRNQIEQLKDVRNEFNDAIDRSSDFLSEIKYVLDVERDFTGALQTDLLETATDILLSPENYVSLVTPNSTDIFDDLAAELKRKTQTYNPLERLTTSKNTGVISPTRLFESEYNISKYEAYMTAMDALGIGAIMNTYNVLLNSLGAVSPESYTVDIGQETVEIPVRILMPHQKRGKRISLSNTYTAKTKDAASHKISDVFNQMINGWVDVGKDPWIFYIQGNKEITPVLMYMIMAGVPVEYAVYFVSQPIIREFVKVKAGTSKEKALEELLGQKSVERIVYISQQEVTEDFKLADLKSQLDPTGYDKDYQEKVLLHFVEILNMSDAFTKFTRATNVDTTRENTYLSTRSREAAIAELFYDGRIDRSLIEAVQDPEKSILGGFFIGDFAIALAKEVLPFRFMSEVDDFINSKSNDDDEYRKLAKAKTSGKNNGNEIINSLFRNDLILALYQNAVRGFTLGSSTSYNGIGVTRDTPVKYADFLKSGVHIAFENGVPVIMVDANQIYKMYNDQASKNDNFKNFYPYVDDYARFLIEYSILDYTNPELDSETKKVNRANFKSLNSYAIFQNQRNSFARILNKLALKNQALREQFVVLQSLFVESVEGYDTITLKDKGLDNITGTSYYNELKALKDFNAVKQRVPSLSDDSIKTINFLFRMLPQVIFLQEGLNKNFSNLVNLIDFKTEINPIIQNAINAVNKDQKESFQNFLESFYASFMENNRIGNKIPVKIYRNRGKVKPVPGAYTRFIPEKIRGVRSKKMNNLLFMQLRDARKPYEQYDRIIDQSSNVIYVVYPTVLNQEKAAKSSYIRNSKTKARYIPIAIGFNNIEDGFVEGGEQTVKQQPQPKQYRTEKIISDEDVRLFNQYRGNRALPEEFFTSKTRFKEFYNTQTGKRETAPQSTKWFLNEKNLYDLIDQETGELYISDVDLSTGLRYIEVQPTQPSTNLPGPETTFTLQGKTIKLGRTQSNINNSGAARGADAYFNFRSADYPVSNMNWHNQDMLKRAKEGKEKDLIIGLMENNPQALITDESEYAKVVQIGASRLGKAAKNPATINKLGRNWYQIKNSDAVFAIVESFYTRPDTGNLDMANVSGGTGWAIAYAAEKIDGRERPIYVFNQSDNKWYQYDYIDEIFKEYSGIPKLTKNFAGIGTRKINEAGKKAIDNLYANTFRATQPSTVANEFDVADNLTPIQQNFKDGDGGRKMQPQFAGKSTMDLIMSGDRTRTTRAKTDIQRMAKDYNLSKISDLVGKVIRMTDKTGRQVYTRITKVTPFTQEYQDATWQKEGWEKAVTDNLVGKYPYAIEFEVIQPSTQTTVQPSQIEYTPENITSLKSNEVFVFGSNTEGRHGDGAAKTAVDKFGAKYGEPKGLQGQSYAIITKDLSKGKRSVSLDSIYNQVIDLNDRAKVRDDLKFYVTKFGTDLAGFTTEEIKQIWQDIHENYIIADNIVLPKEFEVRDKQPAVQGVSSTKGITKTPLQTPSITDAKTPNVEQAKKIIDQQLAKIEEVLSNPENNVIMDNSLLISQKTKDIAGDYAGSKAIADYLYGEIYKRFGLPISGTGKFSVRELIRENQQGIEGVEADKINKEDLNGLDLDGTCFRA